LSSQNTRRDFLKLSGLGAAAVAAGGTLSEAAAKHADSQPASQPGTISVWVTDANRRCEWLESVHWERASGSPASDAVVLNPGKKFQEVLGFGAAFTEASCFTLNRLDPGAREKLFHTLFDPSEMNFGVCRTCIGSSDYSTKMYSYNEGESDPELSRFSIEHDRADVLPILREARKVNPDLFLFSSPWSPPGWMKSNGSMLGGNMRRQHMAAYANYFVKYLQAYESEGVPVQAITVQNEVDTDQDGRMPACIWPQEYEADFVRQHLGPTFQRAGVKSRIWLIDHNYNLWGRALGELETGDVRKYSNAIAWHGYVGKAEWMDRVQERYPDIEMYWTEGGPAYTAANYATDWTEWSKTFAEILRHGCKSITAWNFALDERGRPNIGPFDCGGLVTVDSQSKAISYSGQYWAFAHFSRFVRRGGYRIDSQGGVAVHHVAFGHSDGKQVLVIANPGSARTVQVRAAGYVASVAIGNDSVVTLEWSARG
jgi:glucosylceramidase